MYRMARSYCLVVRFGSNAVEKLPLSARVPRRHRHELATEPIEGQSLVTMEP